MLRLSWLMIFAVALLSGCGKANPNLEGRWKGAEDFDVEFRQGEMYYVMKVAGSEAITKVGKVKFIDAQTIEIELTDEAMEIKKKGYEAAEPFRKADAQLSGKEYKPKPFINTRTIRNGFTLEGDTLTISEPEVKPQTFKRSK